MTIFNKINILKEKANRSKYTERILSELDFSVELSVQKGNKYEDVICECVDFLNASFEKDGALTKDTCIQAERILMPLSDEAKSYRVHCVGHAHIDMNWMWGYQETAALTVDTFRTVLDLMKEYPEFTFGQSQASTFKIIEDYAPEMLTEIKKYIKEGRFEVTASTWVETDKNMPSGESLARHILYTKKYLSKLLDISPEDLNLDFEPDTFGHNITVPEICSMGGVKYYYHCRGNVEMPSNPAYLWRGRSGAELIVWRDPQWYNGGVSPAAFYKVPELCKNCGIDEFLYVYGVGDHGGGPTRRDINKIIEIASWPIMPTIEFSTYGAFFRALEKIKDKLPVKEGEMNVIFTGCYTSQSRIKMANRIAEDRIQESEALSTMANIMADAPKKTESFEKAWQKILFNHFHDILPGSGVIDTREYAMGEFQKAMASIGTNANLAMRALAERIDTSEYVCKTDPSSTAEGAGVGYMTEQHNRYRMPVAERGNGKKRIFHLFNTTGYDFDGVCEIVVWDWLYDASRAEFKDSDGNVCEFKVLESSRGYWDHQYMKIALCTKVGAMGYATYTLDEKEIEGIAGYGLIYPRSDNYIKDEDIVLENNRIKAVFDIKTMKIKSLVDKSNMKEMVDREAGFFKYIKENPRHGMTSWRVGEYMSEEDLNEERIVKFKGADTGAIRRSLSYETTLGERSKLNVKITLDDNSPMLVYDCRVDFHEIGKPGDYIPQLAFTMPLSFSADKFKYDVPFGVIEREGARHDYPANSFAAAMDQRGENGGGMILISDSKYGFRCWENNMQMTLIRASYDPDPYPEYGVHNFKIAVGAVNDCSVKGLMKMRDEFVHPVAMCSARAGKGELPLKGQLFKIEGEALLGSVKNPEKGEGVILRLLEVEGRASEFTVKFEKTPAFVYEVDVNENILNELKIENGAVNGKMKEHSFKNLHVVFEK